MTPPVDAAAVVGEDATFTCVAGSEPTPTITWVFNDQELTNGSEYTITESFATTEMIADVPVATIQSVLVVVGVEEGSGGTYTCRAENTHDTVTDTADADLQPLSKLAPLVQRWCVLTKSF